jgi:hypothetical protein
MCELLGYTVRLKRLRALFENAIEVQAPSSRSSWKQDKQAIWPLLR